MITQTWPDTFLEQQRDYRLASMRVKATIGRVESGLVVESGI